jgi:hypothetical protein
MPYTPKNKNALLLAPKVTAVLGKTTSQKQSHPRPAVGLFSRVCSTRNPGRISRCYQEKVCQAIENKTMSSGYYRCRLEKNRRDRNIIAMFSGHDTFFKAIPQGVKGSRIQGFKGWPFII